MERVFELKSKGKRSGKNEKSVIMVGAFAVEVCRG